MTKGILILSLFAVLGARAHSIDCHTNDVTKELCRSLELFKKCVQNDSECDGNSYLGENMSSAVYYLGRIEAFSKSLKNLGLYSGPIRTRVRTFANEYDDGNVFWALSTDRNFIAFVNALNEKVRTTAESLKN